MKIELEEVSNSPFINRSGVNEWYKYLAKE